MLPTEIPVLIVGAGPAGLTMAVLLERLGIEAMVIERRESPQRAPAAHVVNARTFEILRAAGIDRDAIERASIPPADGGYVDWLTRLGGERIGRLPFGQQGDDQLAVTPTPLRNLSQNKFEPILVEALGTEVHWRSQWESSSQEDDGVVSTFRNLATDEEHEVRSQYVIAADGAGSRIRKSLGIEPIGPEKLQSFVMIHFKGALRDRLGSPPALLGFISDPACSACFVVHDLDHEAVMMCHYDDTQESLEDYDVARCEGLVRAALADPSFDFEVETISTWAMTAQVAERYRDGRIFLVGDSAHRFPPTGGLGLNSGVQDAHNLAWKIAYQLEGRASESILESYEAERRPIAQHNADQSLKNALKMVEVPVALDIVGPEASTEKMNASLADPDTRERAAAAVRNQAEHFDMPGLELGFSYAVDAKPPETRVFEPSGAPGSRLPHAWLSDGESRSLLDALSLGRFTLIAGPEGRAWAEAAKGLGTDCVDVLVLETDTLRDLETWMKQAGIESSGALLVRPDQHVAWRASDDGALAGLEGALDSALRGEPIRLA